MKAFVTYLMAVLLCLSLYSCKKATTQEEGSGNIEVADRENDSKEPETDSLTDATADSKIKVESLNKKDVLLRKTKVQYVIY